MMNQYEREAIVGKATLIASILFLPVLGQAQSIVEIPTPQAIASMTVNADFNKIAVTDEPVPHEAKFLNPNFTIKVHFRKGIDKLQYRSGVGAVFAKLMIAGVPTKRLLPDGEYFLWIGGSGELMRGALAKTDGTFVREIEVLSKPSISEELLAQSPEIISTISVEEVVGFAGPGTPPTPPGGIPPRVPPRNPPPPPPGRTWREVRIPWTPNPDGSIPPPQWVRIPDN